MPSAHRGGPSSSAEKAGLLRIHKLVLSHVNHPEIMGCPKMKLKNEIRLTARVNNSTSWKERHAETDAIITSIKVRTIIKLIHGFQSKSKLPSDISIAKKLQHRLALVGHFCRILFTYSMQLSVCALLHSNLNQATYRF